jgi:hypothetical protein
MAHCVSEPYDRLKLNLLEHLTQHPPHEHFTQEHIDEARRVLMVEGAWGDVLHIVLFVQCYNQVLHIHTPWGVQVFGGSGPRHHLIYYNKVQHESPNHYDVLVPSIPMARHKHTGDVLKVISFNICGNRQLFAWAMEQPVEVLMLQETHLNLQQQQSWMTQARMAGWHGLWVPAQATPQAQKSGGLATLVRLPHLVFESWRDPIFGRALSVGVQYTRTRKMFFHNIYAFDGGYAQRDELNQALLGRLEDHIHVGGSGLHVCGGDLNDPPEDTLPYPFGSNGNLSPINTLVEIAS